ncbi:DUF6087 family protein [Streptomyces sp. NPDC057697]|uniref:DUF6087 family protein n=1 Tax=Streptomyces sp. NPDC057697 TaxID=3346219 RepID=UPI00367D9D69
MLHADAPGARKAVLLGDGSVRGRDVGPDVPRGMLEGDGQAWAPFGVAGGCAAAAQQTGPQGAAGRVPLPRSGAPSPDPEPGRPAEEFWRH